MPIFVDHQLQEQIPRDIFDFPIAFYCDELADLPNRAGPMHWHPCFEIATAQNGVLDYQVGQTHTILEPGDSIFVNQNILHGIRQVSGIEPNHYFFWHSHCLREQRYLSEIHPADFFV